MVEKSFSRGFWSSFKEPFLVAGARLAEMKPIIFAAAGAVLISTGSLDARPKVVAQMPVDDDFYVDDFVTWGGDDQGVGYVAANSIRIHDGVFVLCGAGYYSAAGRLRRLTRQALRDMQLLADGEVVLEDMTFFNTVSKQEFESGTVAYCASTGVPATNRSIEWSTGSRKVRPYRL